MRDVQESMYYMCRGLTELVASTAVVPAVEISVVAAAAVVVVVAAVAAVDASAFGSAFGLAFPCF